jgi:hypothetical protein
MDAPQIRDLFASAMTMYRLERLPAYGPAPQETPQALAQWCDAVRTWTGQGRIVQRVRLLTEPPTDYMRYQLSTAFLDQVEAGEDVRILVSSSAWPDGVTLQQDHWLINGNTLLVLDHSKDGALAFADLVDDEAAVATARGLRDLALGVAVPYTRYVQDG